MAAPIQIVDEDDRPLRAGTKEEAWRDGLYHRIVRIMVDDGSGDFLLQKRADTKPTSPGLWDVSVAGHVDVGETYESAATRELREELGVGGYRLTETDYYPTHGMYGDKKLNRFNRLYTVTIPRDALLRLQSEEVAEVRWFTRAELLELVTDKSRVTGGLIEAAKRLQKP